MFVVVSPDAVILPVASISAVFNRLLNLSYPVNICGDKLVPSDKTASPVPPVNFIKSPAVSIPNEYVGVTAGTIMLVVPCKYIVEVPSKTNPPLDTLNPALFKYLVSVYCLLVKSSGNNGTYELLIFCVFKFTVAFAPM